MRLAKRQGACWLVQQHFTDFLTLWHSRVWRTEWEVTNALKGLCRGLSGESIGAAMIREAETSQVRLSYSITRKNAIATVHPDRWHAMVWT